MRKAKRISRGEKNNEIAKASYRQNRIWVLESYFRPGAKKYFATSVDFVVLVRTFVAQYETALDSKENTLTRRSRAIYLFPVNLGYLDKRRSYFSASRPDAVHIPY